MKEDILQVPSCGIPCFTQPSNLTHFSPSSSFVTFFITFSISVSFFLFFSPIDNPKETSDLCLAEWFTQYLFIQTWHKSWINETWDKNQKSNPNSGQHPRKQHPFWNAFEQSWQTRLVLTRCEPIKATHLANQKILAHSSLLRCECTVFHQSEDDKSGQQVLRAFIL